MDKASLIGINWDKKSSFLQGTAHAPDAIRKVFHNGASNYHAEDGTYLGPDVITDLGNISCNDYMQIYSEFLDILKSTGSKIITLGGDHSITYPVVKALSNVSGGFHMLHIDAHADLYHEFEGDRHSHACPMARIMEEGLVLSMTQIGIRTLNDHQKEQAEKYGVNIIEMKDWSNQKLELQGPLYITLDMDAFDPGFAPGVSHHEPGGFTPRQVIQLIQNIDVPVIGGDIVEYNPARDIHDMTAALSAKLFKEIAAKIIS